MPIYKLNELEEKFFVLKKSAEYLSVNEQLTTASVLRDAIVSDNTIGNACVADSGLLRKKENILNEIKIFINTTIEKVTSEEQKSPESTYATILDFASAKVDLGTLVTEEIDLHMFAENGGPQIFPQCTTSVTHMETLKEVKFNCEESKFNILLVSEFQSGKTTTLNALCGGRHIGEIGSGDATSAVPLFVSYADEESFAIKWKSKENLNKVLSNLTQYFPDFELAEFDLDNTEQRVLWLKKIDENRRSKECPSNTKLLAICSMILKYYGTQELYDKEKSIETIDEVSLITKFPDLSIWKQKGIDGFTMNDSIFVFVEQVDCYCPSVVLKKINATIIDCPGLFYNGYDTSITEKLLTAAHVILYMLPHHKTGNQQNYRSLEKIRDDYSDFVRKLLIIQNFSIINPSTVDGNRRKIEELFEGKKTIDAVYDARVAYLACIKQSNDNGVLPDTDIKEFCKPIKDTEIDLETGEETEVDVIFDDFEHAWNYYFEPYRHKFNYKVPQVDALLNVSKIETVTKKVQSFVEENKAYSMILSNGLDKLQKELIQVSNFLKRGPVKLYNADIAKLEADWNQGIAKAEEFKQKTAPLIERYFYEEQDGRKSLIERLVVGVSNKRFTDGFYGEMIESIAVLIYNNAGQLFKLSKEDKIRDFLFPKVERIVNEKINNRLSFWLGLVKEGKDETFNENFTYEIKLLINELRSEWGKLCSSVEVFKENDIQTYLTIETEIDKYCKDDIQSRKISVSRQEKLYDVLLEAIVGQIVSIVGALLMTFLGSAIVAAAIAAIGSSVIAVLGAIMVVVYGPKAYKWGREKIKERFILHICEKIHEKLERQNLQKDVAQLIHSIVVDILRTCQEKLTINIEKIKEEKIAILSTPEQDKEKACFKAVTVIDEINQQINKYEEYRAKHIVYEDRKN